MLDDFIYDILNEKEMFLGSKEALMLLRDSRKIVNMQKDEMVNYIQEKTHIYTPDVILYVDYNYNTIIHQHKKAVKKYKDIILKNARMIKYRINP